MRLFPGTVVILVLCLLTAVPAFALEGRIVDARTGAPVANAEVSILGRPGVARTDSDGRFEWRPDPVPPFEVLIILAGGGYVNPILVERLDKGPWLLSVTPVLEERVTVTAAAPGIESTPGAATAMVPREDIEVRQPATIAQLLENVAGVSKVSEGQAAVPVVRGMARGRTLILIDGARVTSERRVGPSATFLDPFVLDDVEVARGPGSVAYGSDAFGGVISARTRRVAPGTPLRFRAIAAGGIGTPEGRVGLEVGRGLARGSVLAQVHVRGGGDYRSPEGDVFNSGSRDAGFLLKGEHALGGGLLTATWQSDFAREVERPRNNSRAVRFYYPTEDSHRFTTAYELRDVAGFSTLTFTSFLGADAVVTDQDRVATAAQPRSIERADVSARDFHARGSAERLVGNARVEFGVDLNGRFGLRAVDSVIAYTPAGDLAQQSDNLSVDTARRTDTGVFVMTETTIAPTVLVAGGVRVDAVGTRNEGGYFGDRSTANTAGSGFASVTAGPYAGFSVTGQVARGFRDPVLSDRYFSGPSGRGYITGNPDLEPERSLQFDGAIRYTAPRYRFAFYAYHYRLTDLIERYETARDIFFFRNRGRARLRGVELEAQGTLAGGLTVQLAGQLARGVGLDDGMPLDDLAEPSVSLELRKPIGGRAFAQVRGAAFARDTRPGPTEIVTPGYGLVDVTGGYRVSDQVELRALVRNVLDQPYFASPDPRTVLAPGTSLLVTTLVRF